MSHFRAVPPNDLVFVRWRNHRGFLIEGARIKDTISTDPKIQLLVNEEARERYEESRLASKVGMGCLALHVQRLTF